MNIEALRTRLVPPVRPACLPAPGAWERVEAALGVSLPDDYKDFIAVYGVDGTMSDFLLAVLSGQYESVALGDDFPSTAPAYFDPWWEPHNVTVEFAHVHHTVENQVELVRSIFAAVTRYRDPDSGERYTSESMVVPSRGWRVRYWSNRGSTGTSDDAVGIVIDLPKEDVADFDPYVRRLARSLGGDVLSVVQSDT